MIIDVHTHLFAPSVRQDREAFFNAEPAFKSLYQSPKSRLIGAAELIDAMDLNGVQSSVVFGFPWKNADTFQRNNDYIMEAVERYPGRLLGFGCFDAGHPMAAAETERCLDANLAGIGELAFYHSGPDEQALAKLAPIMDICRDKHVPVMIHTNEPVGHVYPGKSPNTLHQIYNMVKRFAGNRIILAHWGGGLFFYGLLKKEVKDALTNVFFDTAASPFLYDPAIYRVARLIVGLDRILFGSDYPLLPPDRYIEDMQRAGLTAAEIDAICGGNANRLLFDR